MTIHHHNRLLLITTITSNKEDSTEIIIYDRHTCVVMLRVRTIIKTRLSTKNKLYRTRVCRQIH